MTTAVDYEFRSEFATEYVKLGEAQGEAQGEARSEAHAVLAVLEGRGIAVSADLRDRILACTDLAQLDTWLRRASTATAIEGVIEDVIEDVIDG